MSQPHLPHHEPARDVAAALAHHRAGRRAQAEALCRAVLERDPRNAGALRVLAVMAHSQGRLRPALRLARMAVAAAPGVPEHLNTLGTVLGDLRQWEECFNAFAEAEKLRGKASGPTLHS
jgi:Tfp pilus assembly protein PilF